MKWWNKYFSITTQIRFLVYVMGCFKVPLIGYTDPKLLEINDKEAVLRIKLKRRTKNHLNSMYFGVLAVGADLAAGVHAFYYAKQAGVSIAFAFKDFKAEFLRRAETDVIFKTEDGLVIQEAFQKALLSGERENRMIAVNAFSTDGECVAKFWLTASIKCKK